MDVRGGMRFHGAVLDLERNLLHRFRSLRKSAIPIPRLVRRHRLLRTEMALADRDWASRLRPIKNSRGETNILDYSASLPRRQSLGRDSFRNNLEQIWNSLLGLVSFLRKPSGAKVGSFQNYPHGCHRTQRVCECRWRHSDISGFPIYVEPSICGSPRTF